MKFEHEIATEVSRDSLWSVLIDVPRVARCIPGVEEVKAIGDGTYCGTMRIRLGPVGVNLEGTLQVQQDEKQGRFRILAQAQDRRVGGGVQSTIETAITEPTLGLAGLRVSADVQFMGRLAHLGQAIIKRKADSIVKEFAENLKESVAQGN